MCFKMGVVVHIVFYFFLLTYGKGEKADQTPVIGRKGTRCYDDFNRPQRCIPEFENAAFNLLMEATNTCGDHGEMEYCVQTGVTGIRKSCEICYPNQHDARYLTDFHQQENPTWWQSETMLEGIQWPSQVNLTLRFGKAFDITYMRLWFWSPRPESFYISKKTTEDGPWIAYQYYSATCRDTYGLPDGTHTSRGEETRALCTSEYSDISPLKGGNVAFGTLEGRPSAYNFDGSPELQEWVTATEIMITLDRINTFGDEVFGDQQVLRSYFYAIADVAIGARCKCNGHASECITPTGNNGHERKVCKCEHNTAGPDCNVCLPFYNDRPWARASAKDANECKQCNCNGYSDSCYFDQKLYEQTGHGGHCLDCTANRDGPNCEVCRENYYMREDGYCIPCNCDETGSRTFQCNVEGKCQCKPGVNGDKCDRCNVNHFDFTTYGCKSCGCSELGSINNEPQCDQISGGCYCKENVEGKRCTECKPGFFHLDADNTFGCTPCFCYGHSSQCKSAVGYSKYTLESTFRQSSEKWTAEGEYGIKRDVKYDALTQSIGVRSTTEESVYFVAPNRFLGDQRASYNQQLEFSLRIGDNRPVPTATDIILEGEKSSVTNTIFAQQNRMPNMQNQKYSFRLHEHSNYGWQPRLPFRDFFSLLTNLTSIKIKGTYGLQGVGYLNDFKLESALRGLPTEPALWVESCDCPTGYVGQFCESCAAGYRHSPGPGGPFMPCVPCDCNNHADVCDYETGRCFCHHHTTGDNCELCARGYYGNALEGTPEDCLPCNCPGGGACVQVDEDTVLCTECPVGYTGHRCDSCSDGYYGDPTEKFGSITSCKPCECNSNTDPNAIGNCNTTTGECLRCIHNTAGPQCDVCLPGYYGNALVLPKGDCKPCQCYPPGTEEDISGAPNCDQSTGSCQCKSHVVGKNCDKCENGYYNLHNAEGCQSCNCDPIGSLNQTCDIYTGQCYCRPGVTGLRCDHCETRKYGFSYEGCKKCECDIIGSKDLQCDALGKCPCLENVEGEKCDRCKENKHDRQRGCVDCPDCYNLVQNAARSHNNKLNKLNEILNDIERQPIVTSDEDFPQELKNLEEDIVEFHETVVDATGERSLLQQVKNVREREKDISRTLSEVDENIFLVSDKKFRVEQDVFHADQILEEASEKLNELNNTFDYQSQTALEEARDRAKIAGQHSDKMTDLAHEARDIADALETTADGIVVKAKEAKDKSIEAYNEAKTANANQSHIDDAIRYIKSDLLDTDLKLRKTKEWTNEVSERALTVKNNAVALLNEVRNLQIPQIDVPKLKEKSRELQEEAYRLRNKTADLFYNSDELRKNIDEQNYIGRELMEKAQDQQGEINDLRNDLVFGKSQADGAINLWNEILKGAETNYKLLTDFDTQTQKSKEEAEAALKTINEIENIINEITDKTTDAQNNLEDAKKNANFALEKAVQAEAVARNASHKADDIKNDAQVLYKNTTALSEETELMFDRVQNTEGEYKNLLEKTKSNYTLVNEAKEKVGRAAKDTKEASKRVSDLLDDVESIMAELQNSPEINEKEIDRLEEQIRLTEEQIKEAKLDEKLDMLRKEQKMQDELINQYKNEILMLQKEVENVRQIVKALPDGCFKRVELEP